MADSSVGAAVKSYAQDLLVSGGRGPQAQRASLADAAWLGCLAVAGGIVWRGLVAHPALRLAVTGYLAVEGLFYLVGKLRLRHLGRLPEDAPDTSRLQVQFQRFLELRDVFCINKFLSGWFMGAPHEAVLRGNVLEFVAYGFHCKPLHELSAVDRGEVQQFVSDVEARWGVRFAPGFNPSLPFMAHVWEPLRAYHKPLIMFAITELLARVAHLLMFLMGFRQKRQGRFSYWLARRAGVAGGGEDGSSVLSQPNPPLPGLRRHSTGDAGAAGTGGWGGVLSPRSAALAGMRRHSTSETLTDAVHHAADAVHLAAEHALDATLTVTSAAAAAVAAQHPHGSGSGALLSPRALSPVPHAPSPLPSPSVPPAPAQQAQQADPAAAATAAAAAAAPAQQAHLGHSLSPPRRRAKGDSAVDFDSGSVLADAAAAASAATAAAAGVSTEDATEAAGGPLPSAFRLAAGAANGDAADAGGASSPADSAAGAGGSAAGGAGAVSTRPDVPIVFLHGVGFGVLPYLHLVRDIMYACPDTPVLMLEVPHVALRLCWEAAKVDDVAHAVVEALSKHGYRKACIVGHSYGTFVASRLCQLYPKVVHSCCLLDPVAMLTCYPQLLYNFIYKEPSMANFTTLSGAIDLIRFICSRDLTIAQAFCRKFYWNELMLWPQDLPRRSLVVLSGQDDLVPSELVMAHMKLAGHPAKVMHHPDLGHGGLLLSPAWQAEFVRNLQAMLLV